MSWAHITRATCSDVARVPTSPMNTPKQTSAVAPAVDTCCFRSTSSVCALEISTTLMKNKAGRMYTKHTPTVLPINANTTPMSGTQSPTKSESRTMATVMAMCPMFSATPPSSIFWNREAKKSFFTEFRAPWQTRGKEKDTARDMAANAVATNMLGGWLRSTQKLTRILGCVSSMNRRYPVVPTMTYTARHMPVLDLTTVCMRGMLRRLSSQYMSMVL
mmetsp:Transcript_18226/g.36773  ORF Transcript_18226/g.36773 Transcript_18226/m.36773 type:complete len:218 (-) Transcript_18226:844-1497(-)